MSCHQAIRMMLIAVSLVSFQSYAQELYLIKSAKAPTMCLQNGDNLQLQPCDPQNEKQRWDILKESGGIFTAGSTYGWNVYIDTQLGMTRNAGLVWPPGSSAVASKLVMQDSQRKNLCLGLYQEKTAAGTMVPFQECKDWLGKTKEHNQWTTEKVNLPPPIPPGEAVSAGNFICLGHNYKSQFADKYSLMDVEYFQLPSGSNTFNFTTRFCTDPKKWMAGDIILLKVPANTIPCNGIVYGKSKSCMDYRDGLQGPYISITARTDHPNSSPSWYVYPNDGIKSWFIFENGKYKSIDIKNIVDFLNQDLYTLIAVYPNSSGGESLLESPDGNNPPSKVLNIFAHALNHKDPRTSLRKPFPLGSVRLAAYVSTQQLTPDQITAKCGEKDIRGRLGQGTESRDITERFRGDYWCSKENTLSLRSSPFRRYNPGGYRNPGSHYAAGILICSADAMANMSLIMEPVSNLPNMHTYKVHRSSPSILDFEGMLGDTQYPRQKGKCLINSDFSNKVKVLPDGSVECIECPIIGDQNNLIIAFQMYRHQTTRLIAPDEITNWHYFQVLGAYNISNTPPTSPPLTPIQPPPLTPIQPPSPPPAAAPQPTPSTKQTNLFGKGRNTELGVRQSYLRPNYGNLIPNPRGLGGWEKDVGAGLQNHDWDVPAAIHWRKIDQNALFHNHPDRNHYYPDGWIPVINSDSEFTYRISTMDIVALIRAQGYSDEADKFVYELKPGHQQCELNLVSYTNGVPSNPKKYVLKQNKGEEFVNRGTIDYYFEGALSASEVENFLNQTITGTQARQGIEFGARVECQIPGIKKGNVTENFRYHTKQRNFIWQKDSPVFFLSSKNDGLENSLFKLDWQFSLAFDSRGRWGSNGGLMVPFSRVPPYAANPWQAELNKLTLCPDNKCALMNIYIAPDIGGGAVFNRLKRSLPMNQEFYSTSNKSINEVLNTTELNFNVGFFFTYELNYGAGDVLRYTGSNKTDTVPRSFGPVWAAPNSQRAKNYLRKLRPNVDPKILESRWLERQQYLRSKDFDNQSISRTLAYCQIDPAFPDRFGYARYGFPLDPNGVLNDLARDPDGKCAWLDTPTASETPKVDPPKTLPSGETCNQNLAPTCSTNPRFSKMRFGAYYFRDSATSARPEPFNIYLKENATYVIGEREDQPKFSGNYFICGDKIHFQNLTKVGTFTQNNQLVMDSFLPNLAGVPKVFLCTGTACRSEAEVPPAAKLCQAVFKKVDPPPAVKNLDEIKGVQEEKQTELPKGEIIKLPQSAEDVKIIPKLQPIAPPKVDEPLRPVAPPRMVPTPNPIPPPPSSAPRDTGIQQNRPVPELPRPILVTPPPPAPPVRPSAPPPENRPVPVAKPEPAPPPAKPAAPPAKKEPEFSVPIAR